MELAHCQEAGRRGILQVTVAAKVPGLEIGLGSEKYPL